MFTKIFVFGTNYKRQKVKLLHIDLMVRFNKMFFIILVSKSKTKFHFSFVINTFFCYLRGKKIVVRQKTKKEKKKYLTKKIW